MQPKKLLYSALEIMHRAAIATTRPLKQLLITVIAAGFCLASRTNAADRVEWVAAGGVWRDVPDVPIQKGHARLKAGKHRKLKGNEKYLKTGIHAH